MSIGDLNREQMVAALLREFPSMKGDVLDETRSGLLHLQMGCFARYARARVDAGDRSGVTRCFDLANRFLCDGTSELRNAVVVSFLEALNFEDGKRLRSWARDLVPGPLRRELEAIDKS